ncbi:DUF262 domain-containing protein [Clostridium botulinum]|nr:DUF262 domain-containing protein [Clostridium botulinum]
MKEWKKLLKYIQKGWGFVELNSKFKIDSKEIGDLYRLIINKELIYDPFYQRNFVWSAVHQKEFIKTIIGGYPCPEIFIAEGELDLETHIKYIHVIDGQQRLRTIAAYFANALEVDGKRFKDLPEDEQRRIHSYEIGVVTLKLNPKQDIEEIQEIFRRLNINAYSLTETEKTISRLSDNEFMLMARLYTGDITFDLDNESDSPAEKFRHNPFIKDSFKNWASKMNFENIKRFFLNRDIYSEKEIKENTNTKDCMDMIQIILKNKFHSRILTEDEILEATEDVVKMKGKLYRIFNDSIKLFFLIDFPEVTGYKKKKYLLNRGNAFSLLLALALNYDYFDEINIEKLQEEINKFCSEIPKEFEFAARNSVMEKKQRELRNKYMQNILRKCIQQ